MVRTILSTLLMGLLGTLIVDFATAEEIKCEGVIAKVEGENVTVKEETKERLMKVEPGTRITSAGKPVSVMDLKVGQKVKCVCDQRGAQLICTAMEIMRDTP